MIRSDGVASLAFAATNRTIARYAQQRGFLALGPYPPDELAQLRGRVQAETASRELLQAVIEPRATPHGAKVGVQIKAVLTLVQTILAHSTLEYETPPRITVDYRLVEVPHPTARLLRDAALLLVLCALDDGALDIRVSVDRDTTAVQVRVRSDSPGLVSVRETDDGRALTARIRDAQGVVMWGACGVRDTWDGELWDVVLCLPVDAPPDSVDE